MRICGESAKSLLFQRSDAARWPRTTTGETGTYVIEMTRERFEELVSDALDEIPAELASKIDNVVVLVEDEAPADDPTLLGVYDGVPLTERTPMWSSGFLPDRITIFRNPTLAICDSEEDVVEEVLVTVVHEVAHYFGIDDARLHELGWA